MFKRFVSGKSDGDMCTMYADRTLINRRNVTCDPHGAYRVNRDFLLLVIQSRIIAAAMEVLGMTSRSSQPTECPVGNDMARMSNYQKREYLHKAAAMIVDKFVFDEGSVNQLVDNILMAQEKQDVLDNQQLTPEGRFPCRFPGCTYTFKFDGRSRHKHELTHNPPPSVPDTNTPSSSSPQSVTMIKTATKQDDVYNYNCGLLADGLFFMNFLDATAEGDGARMMRQYKYLLLYCRADGTHSTKYALECLYQSFLTNALLTPRDSECFTWNRTVNTNGGVGNNIAMDLEVEHSNNFDKQGIRNVGPNVTENAVARICNSEGGCRTITDKVDKSIQRSAGSNVHTHRSTARDLDELVKKAVDTNIFKRHDNRPYTHFINFERDPFKDVDMSAMFQWINKHKRNVVCGIRAR